MAKEEAALRAKEIAEAKRNADEYEREQVRLAVERSKIQMDQPKEEEKKAEEPVKAPVTQPPRELVEIITPGLSEAEQRKLEELRKMKAQAKLTKQENNSSTEHES